MDNTFHIHRLAREEVKSKYKVSSDEFNFHFFGGFNIQVIVSKFSNLNIKTVFPNLGNTQNGLVFDGPSKLQFNLNFIY